MMRRFEGMRKAENLLFPALGLAIGALLAGGQYLAPREAGNARAGAASTTTLSKLVAIDCGVASCVIVR